tara:strand:+ start:429 stop:1091 length:663 start_codon:yes stop_codon:yes gene_type:complete
MSNEFNLTVDKRELSNKGGRKRALKEGKIPGIYYSHDSKNSIPFYITKKEILNAQKADTQIFNISVGGKKRNVLFKSVQYHPVTDEILHIDLYGIKMDQVVTVSIPILIEGSAKGVVEGGILVQNLNEVEIDCLPSDIPQNILLDITNLEMGESLRCENLELDEKFSLKTPSDQIVVSVTQPAQETEESTDDVDSSSSDEPTDSSGSEDSSDSEDDSKEG